jgi:23S rRNA pseudouridine2605 synthase
VPKVYRVEVRGQVATEVVAKLKQGVHLAEGKVTASSVEVTHRSRQSSVLMITLREGRNRQVRRMLARLNHPVKTLKRVQIGPLQIKGLPVGACRRLTPRELTELRRAIGAAKKRSTARKTAKPRADRPKKTEATKPSAKPAAPGTGAARRPRPADSSEPSRPRRRLIT